MVNPAFYTYDYSRKRVLGESMYIGQGRLVRCLWQWCILFLMGMDDLWPDGGGKIVRGSETTAAVLFHQRHSVVHETKTKDTPKCH